MLRTRQLPLVLALLALPAAVQAERRNPLEGQPAIRHKFEMRKLRFELTPQFLVSLNQDFRTFIGGGALLQFHFADWIGIGIQGGGGGGLDTALTGKIADALPATSMDGQSAPSKQQFKDHLSTIQAVFSVHLTLTPFAGKLMMFGALQLRYDFYGLIGFGGLLSGNSYDSTRSDSNDPMCRNSDPNKCEPGNKGFAAGLALGLGTHLFFNYFVGLNLEVRDYVVNSNWGGLDVNGDRKIDGSDQTFANNLFFSFGVTIMLPPKAKVSN